MEAQSRPAEILLIDDNPGDLELIQEALQSGRVMNHVSMATDGDVAMNFLNRARGFENAPRPDLILLDLNLPRKDGFEVLKEVREHPELSRTPVVILTSSQADRDILKSYVGGGEKGYQYGGREGARCGVTIWLPVGAEIGKKLTASALRPDFPRFWPEGCDKSCL